MDDKLNLESLGEELNRNEDIHAQFRPHSSQAYIHALPKSWMEPGKMYRRVAESFNYCPFHIDKALGKGWKVMYYPGSELTSKANSIKQKENIHSGPIRVVTANGAVSYWMWIDEKRYQANLRKADLERKALLKASITTSKSPTGIREVDNDIYDPLASK